MRPTQHLRRRSSSIPSSPHGRHFGAELAAKTRTPADKFPTNFKENTAPDNAAPTVRVVAGKLHAALASNDAKGAAALFSSDGVYEDMTLRTQVLDRLAIERYFGRALAKLPAGCGSSVLHAFGGGMGWGGVRLACKVGPGYHA